ncbi:MAG: penicillin-insensitive murein endopeptidase [Myxococcales bacterium]
MKRSGILIGLLMWLSAATAASQARQVRQVSHRVLPGERLSEIAARYAVEPQRILEHNGIERHQLRAGQTLEVEAERVPPPRKQVQYLVRFGDNWDSIAERHGVTRAQLRHWNPDVPREFAAGTRLVVWVDEGFEPQPMTGGLGVDRDASGLPLKPVPMGGESRGRPDRGRLHKGVQLPENPELYLIRRSDFAYGSSHAVLNLQLGLAKFRQHSGYTGPLVVSDMSPYRGRGFGSHDSHQSGRDVDVWLPLKLQPDGATVRGVRLSPGDEPDFRLLSAQRAADVDWSATWELVKALIRTGEVQYIFLSRSRQRHLYRAARAEGHDVRELGEVLQYPRRAQTAIVRHAPDHTRHLHVRFRCADHERRCR